MVQVFKSAGLLIGDPRRCSKKKGALICRWYVYVNITTADSAQFNETAE